MRCDIVVNEGAGEVFEYDGRRVYGVCVAEKGVFRFTLTTEGRAGHASIPRIGDNALTKMAPLLEALRDGRPAYELSPEPGGVHPLARHRPGGPRRGAPEVEEANPFVAILLEPMLGVTLTPTMISASRRST